MPNWHRNHTVGPASDVLTHGRTEVERFYASIGVVGRLDWRYYLHLFVGTEGIELSNN